MINIKFADLIVNDDGSITIIDKISGEEVRISFSIVNKIGTSIAQYRGYIPIKEYDPDDRIVQR